jgi:Saccharopine dehydrogenase NADP binding domain
MHGAPERGAPSRSLPGMTLRILCGQCHHVGASGRALERDSTHDQKPVVIYGANGFSGRLITEFLREYNTPFIALGRSSGRTKDVMDHVPGIETADFEIVETAGSLEDLIRLFDGAKVVCNTAGPFLYNGPRVIEAALKSGCHYIDIGGEQAWAREVAENRATNLVLEGSWARPRRPSCVR